MDPHLTILQWSLLGCALWTLGILMFTIGVHRWSRILLGRAAIHEFPADAAGGPGWYQRATRAHANCIENLPVFAVIVLIAYLTGARGWLLDGLGVLILGARLVQSMVHISFVQTSRAVSVRFSFFMVQLVAMLVLVFAIVRG
jgi:uncharacterized MAPEG superfamily protein